MSVSLVTDFVASKGASIAKQALTVEASTITGLTANFDGKSFGNNGFDFAPAADNVNSAPAAPALSA